MTNPLTARLRIPGETFRLPSRGLFYVSGELDDSVKDGELEVLPLTAIDEIIMSTPDKLLSGKAIIEVFHRCIPQVIKPEKLLSKDVDYLMVCLRMVTFGPEIDITYTHTCQDANLHTYTVLVQDLLRRCKSVDPTTMDKEYAVALPNGQQVQLKPMVYEDVVELYRTAALTKDKQISTEEATSLVIGALVSVIQSVDGITNRQQIEEWVSSIPLSWKRQIETTAQRVTDWGMDFDVKQICQDCGEEVDISVSANPVGFFM
jgi:hypothetical protein